MKPGEQKLLIHEVAQVMNSWDMERAVMENHFREKDWPQLHRDPSHVDIMETWAGTMPFTLKCGAYGMCALEPGDLWNGWDYTNAADYQRVVQNAKTRKPKLLVASVECTPWCWWNTKVNYVDQPAMLAEMQKRCVVFLNLCLELFQIQLAHGGHMFLENPGGSSLFNHRAAKEVFRLIVVYMGRARRIVVRYIDMCRSGTTNPEGLSVRERLAP